MPSLIVSSRFTTDSQLLRSTARELGWETLRLDGTELPEWFDPPDDQIAMFYTAPHAFQVAEQLGRSLLGCHPSWTVDLPAELRQRTIQQLTLAEALKLPGRQFIKHAVSKAFEAAVMDSSELATAAAKLSPQALLHVAEPVTWTVEYRCYVANREVQAIAAYRREGQICHEHEDLGATADELTIARQFAERVLNTPDVATPPAFVMDVGIIEGRGWAVVEPNECWASGVYACHPQSVLRTLLRACVPTSSLDDRSWDFETHYRTACG